MGGQGCWPCEPGTAKEAGSTVAGQLDQHFKGNTFERKHTRIRARHRSASRRLTHRRRLLAERLEDRRVLAATLPVFESFEVADLAALTDWTFATNSSGTVALDSVSAAHDGTTSLRFDVANDFDFSATSQAVLQLDLTSVSTATDLAFDFWMKRLNSSTATTFFLQVDASGDGTNWTTLSPKLQPEGNVWVNYVYDLDERLEDADIAMDSDVFIRLRQSAYHSTHDVLIDRVQVRQADVIGPMGTALTPNATIAPLSSFVVTFSEPIDPATFAVADVILYGPDGLPVALSGDPVDSGDQTAFTVNLAQPQSLVGQYRAVVGPSLTDALGNAMNQDGDESNGEAGADDQYVDTFLLGSPVPQTVPYTQGFEVDSLDQMPGWSFGVSLGGQISLGTSTPHSGAKRLGFSQTASNVLTIQEATLLLDLTSQATASDLALDFFLLRPASSASVVTNQLTIEASGDGANWIPLTDPLVGTVGSYVNYFLDLDQSLDDASIVRDSDVYLRFRREGGQTDRFMYLDDIRIDNRDPEGPRIVAVTPINTVAAPVNQIEVEFDEVIELASFTKGDVSLLDPAGFPVTVNSIADTGDGMTFLIQIPDQSVMGSFRLAIGPDIVNLAGNAMNQDMDSVNGEPQEDGFQHTFDIGPPVPQSVPYFQDFEVDSLDQLPGWHFETMQAGQVSLSQAQGPHSGLTHLISGQGSNLASTRHAMFVLDLQDQATATDLWFDFWVKRLFTNNSSNVLTLDASGDGTTWVPIGSPIRTDLNLYVNHTLDLDAALSAASIVLDQDVYLRFSQTGPSLSYQFAIDDVRVSQTEVDGPAVMTMTPAGTVGAPLNQFQLVFDEPIDASSFTVDDVTISGPLGFIELAGDPQDTGDQRAFTLVLASDQFIGGAYEVTIGTGVTDLAGNPMNQDGDEINAEVSDQFTGSVVVGATTVTIPYAQGFDEPAQIGNQWTLVRADTGRIQLVADGERNVMRFDNPGGGSSNAAIVAVDLVGKTGVKLLLEEQNLNDSFQTVDGIFISDNQGASWVKIQDGVPASPDWQLHQIDLDAATVAAGLSYTSDFWIRIHNFSSGSWTSQGRQYDNFILEDVDPIALSLDVTTVSEGSATTPMLRVSRGAGASSSQDVMLSLSSSDVSEASIAAASSIPATFDFVDIPITVENDAEIDGPQVVEFVVTAAGGAPRSIRMTVLDDEPATLLVSADNEIVNEATGPNASYVTVTRNRDVDVDLQVDLTSSDETAFTVPPSVIIPAGKTSVTFGITTHNDYFIDGMQDATVTATAVGNVEGAIQISVENDDTLDQRTIGGRFSGTLPADTHTATFDVIVPDGQTWEILPGTTIWFDLATQLVVEGTLIAQGESEGPILLTSSAATAVPGDWQGVVIAGVSQATSILDQVEIAYAEYGVRMPNHDPRVLIRNADLHHHRMAGIGATIGAGEFIGRDVLIESNRIHDNPGYGIELTAAGRSGTGSSNVSPSISGNEIFGNTKSGIYMSARYTPISGQSIRSGSASPLVSGNHIHDNAMGIEAYPFSHGGTFGSTSVIPEIYNNVIESNVGHAIVVGGSTRAFNNSQVLNNTLVLNGGAGLMHSGDSSSGMLVGNNIVVGNGGGIQADAAFTPSAQQVGFNNTFDNTSGSWSNYPVGFGDLTTTNANGAPSDVEFNIGVDPMFVAGTLFEVEPASPVNDAGASGGQPYDDFYGRLRDAPYDMGAYEHDFVTNIVTTLLDEDDGGLGLGTGNSLREIINATNARLIPDTIAFDTALFGGTIVLNGTQLPTITDTTTIQGPGAGLLAISGNGLSRVFQIGSSTTVDLTGLTVRDGSGGGIFNQGTLTIQDSVVTGNNALTGGGVYSTANLLIERTTISGNMASGNGGGMFVRGNATIIDSTIEGNTTVGDGGGIFNDGTTAVFNSTLSGNKAGANGGAISHVSSSDTTSLRHVTITLNRSDLNGVNAGTGGGVYGGRLKLENSIVAENFRGTTPNELATSLLLPALHNVIGDAATANGLTDGVDGNRVGVDARLAPLANNGGPTRTHALLLGSPAIDAGDSSLAIGPDGMPLLYDQRGPGYARIIEGNGSGAADVDAGAFESMLQVPLVQSIVINGGAAQRSAVTAVRVTFNTIVEIDQLTSDPFLFIDLDSGDAIADVPVITIVNGRTVVDFTFAAGPYVNAGGSLIDGQYQLTVDGDRVSAYGMALDGDDDGMVGGNRLFGAQAADRFFRKYGDQTGNYLVDLLDFAEFRRTFGLIQGEPSYQPSLDSNYNGVIELLDFAAFRERFGT